MRWQATRRQRAPTMAGMSEWGAFPFGKPNTERPARRGKRGAVVVIGVCPSAWHVSWTAPTHLIAGQSGGVQAMPVDVAPAGLSDEAQDDFGARLLAWKQDVGFRDGEHGTLGPVATIGDGVRGKVKVHYLTPLGLEPERVTFTDVFPVFMVRRSTGAKREQGDMIFQEYDPIASAMGFSPCTLPARLDEEELPRVAAERFGTRLLDDLGQAHPTLVITLGHEVWETLMRLPALRPQSPVASFEALKSDHYGAVGSLFINAGRVNWLPLVHPSVLGRPSEWETLHAAWAVSPKLLL